MAWELQWPYVYQTRLTNFSFYYWSHWCRINYFIYIGVCIVFESIQQRHVCICKFIWTCVWTILKACCKVRVCKIFCAIVWHSYAAWLGTWVLTACLLNPERLGLVTEFYPHVLRTLHQGSHLQPPKIPPTSLLIPCAPFLTIPLPPPTYHLPSPSLTWLGCFSFMYCLAERRNGCPKGSQKALCVCCVCVCVRMIEWGNKRKRPEYPPPQKKNKQTNKQQHPPPPKKKPHSCCMFHILQS